MLKVTQLTKDVQGNLEAGPTCKTVTSADKVRSEDLKVCFKYTLEGDRPLFRSSTASPIMVTDADGTELSVESHFKNNEWTFRVEAKDTGKLTASIGKGAAVDSLGHSNPLTSTTVSALFPKSGRNLIASSPSSPDCLVSSWSKWSSCSQSCVAYSATFDVAPGSKSRTRTIVRPAVEGGIACPVLSETTSCSAPVDCLHGSRPYSGETGTECGGPKCSPSNPISEHDPFRELAGCECKPGCEETGSCCQAWYSRDCCDGGSCENRFTAYVFKGEFPLVCRPAQCGSDRAIKVPASRNYYCWCDSQCAVDNQCCGGTDSRNNVCASIN